MSRSRRLERFRCSREREPHSRERGRHGTRTGVERAIAIGREGTAPDTHAMPEDAVKLTPTVLWAQRKDRLLITIDLPNPEHPRVNLEEEGRLTFSATAGKDGEERREYEVVLEFLHPVNAKDSKISVGNRQVFVVVMKTEEVSGRENRSPPRASAPCYRPEPTVQTPPRDPRDGIDVPRARIHRDTRASKRVPPGPVPSTVGSSEEKRRDVPSFPFPRRLRPRLSDAPRDSPATPTRPPRIRPRAVLRRALAAAAQGQGQGAARQDRL